MTPAEREREEFRRYTLSRCDDCWHTSYEIAGTATGSHYTRTLGALRHLRSKGYVDYRFDKSLGAGEWALTEAGMKQEVFSA